jgi:hypothetical protein
LFVAQNEEIMKKILKLVVICTGILSSVLAGNLEDHRLLKLSLSDFWSNVDFEGMTIMLGRETPITDVFSVNHEYGYVTHFNTKGSMITRNVHSIQGAKIELELRRYLPFRSKDFYSGFQMFAKYMDISDSHTASALSGGTISGRTYFTEFYSIYRSEVAAHVVFGIQSPTPHNQRLDYSIGLGYRYITSSNNAEYHLGYTSGDGIFDKKLDMGSGWFPSFTIDVRLAIGK